MNDTPETDKIVKDSKHIKFLEEDHWSLNGKFTYTHPIVCLCRKLEQQRDMLAEALEIVLNEVRNDYMACKDEIKAALAAAKGGSDE
jgi:hypothetical protein